MGCYAHVKTVGDCSISPPRRVHGLGGGPLRYVESAFVLSVSNLPTSIRCHLRYVLSLTPSSKPCFAPNTSSTFLQPRSIFSPMETPDENVGLSCIVDWGYLESQYGTPHADHAQQTGALRGQPGFAPPPNATEHAFCMEETVAGVTDVLGTQVPNSQFFGSRGPGRGSPCRDVDATLLLPLSSPRTPVAGLSYGVTVRDENYLRQQFWMRAIAMAKGQSRNPFVVAGSRVPHLSPSHSEALRTVTPATSPLAVGDCSNGPRRSLDGGSAGFIDGGLGNPDVPIRAHVSPQALPSRDANAHAANDGPSYVPATDVGGYGSSAGGRPQRGRVRLPDPPKNLDRWGEEETTVLCQTRNETKALLGEETEGMGRARAKAGFWKNVEDRMWERGYNRDHYQCKGKFSQVMDFYRPLTIHEGWSGLPSYWDMNQTKRKRYNEEGDEWDKNDAKFKVLTQQIVGSITTRPAGKEVTGGASVNPVRAPSLLPKDRSTKVDSGIQDAKEVVEGTMNIIQLKEMFLLQNGSGDEKGEPWDVKRLAERYKVDAEALENVIWNMSLPTVPTTTVDDGDRVSVWREPN
ncbi:hypothetical protein CBR_g29894 [Chara braunii]|uniref:Myb/SANT-like DNA-binding domain-containing protein n=1 Tax=Chara braunii TaxID=69332 RepID=A0A388JWV8_CHABU|nr:hypothetical protein CBR_g29894 [Chara braunii]|eukprot:GBG62286.1 hypothetical protein CBR_g29894 [Chara braunii]